jgi:hypothetical protein
METISAIKQKTNQSALELHSAVQVIGTTVNKMYIGCLGIILEKNKETSIVGFYTPNTSNKYPFVTKAEFKDSDLELIGVPTLKPKK